MNKRILKYVAPALAATLVITSCSDLDTDPLTSTVTTGQKVDAKEHNPEMVLAGVTGVAAALNTYMTILDRHNDFGYPALMLFSDSRGEDMVSANTGYNWFAGATEMSDCNTTSDHTRLAWGIPYQVIFAANAVLAETEADTTDPEVQFYRAQAMAFRAFAYMRLAQTYQFTYAGHQTDPCVMLITDENQAETGVSGAPRATVEEVYAQIMTDLNSAVTLLEESGVRPSDVLAASPKRFISLPAAYGLRARANLVMQKWADAEADAQAAISLARNYGLTPLTFAEAAQPGFTDLSSHSWMWGIPVAETDRVATSGIINFPSHMGSLNYGYASVGAWRLINEKLFGQIPATDARRGWWLNADGLSANLTDAQAAYAASAGVPAFGQVKFGPNQGVLGTSNNASDIPLMRVEEMYLILAEATAMNGNPAGGASILADFVKTWRDPAYTLSASTAADVQDAVLLQRRIELWGEGITYFDFMRLNKPIDRRGGGFPTEWVYVVEPGSNVLRLPIPNTEVQGNEIFRNAANNNPGAPAPVSVAEL